MLQDNKLPLACLSGHMLGWCKVLAQLARDVGPHFSGGGGDSCSPHLVHSEDIAHQLHHTGISWHLITNCWQEEAPTNGQGKSRKGQGSTCNEQPV